MSLLIVVVCWGIRHQVWIEGYFTWPKDIESPRVIGFWVQFRKLSTFINMIADEHKAFIQVYWKEPILKHGMDALTKKSSFANGWSLLGACFPNLIDYCGIVDFFSENKHRWVRFHLTRGERHVPSSAIWFRFGRGVTQTKQYLLIQQRLSNYLILKCSIYLPPILTVLDVIRTR